MTELTIKSAEELWEPTQARRIRWSGVLAAFVCLVHFFSATILVGWNFWIVQGWKHEFNSYGVPLTPQVSYVIAISTCVFDYWYVLIPVAPVTLALDFVVTRWIARHIGLLSASFVGLSVVVLILGNMAIGQYLLIDAKFQILKMVSIHGPSPQAQMPNL